MSNRVIVRAPTCLLSLCIALAPATRAEASPQDLFGYGARTPALAMTGTSYEEGVEATFANVAGLGAARRRALMLGVHGFGYSLEIDGERQPIIPARGITIGFQLPLALGDVLEDRLVLGGAFFTPADYLMRGVVRFPEVPQWTVLERAQVVGIMIGLGLDLHGVIDGLQIGGGVSATGNLYGRLTVSLDDSLSFSAEDEEQLLTSFAPLIGVRYAQPEWGVGVTYRHELAASMRLEIVAMDLPVELPVLIIGGLVQYDPPTLIAEGYWWPIPDLMLVLNLTTRFWSTFAGTQMASSSSSLLAPAPEFSIVPSPRAAIEGTIRDRNFILAVRGGYAYEASPAPPARIAPRRDSSGNEVPGEDVPFRLIDNDRHILTAGLGWTIHLGDGGERLVLDLFGQLHILASRTHEVGRTDDSEPMQTDGTIFGGGWTLSVEFR